MTILTEIDDANQTADLLQHADAQLEVQLKYEGYIQKQQQQVHALSEARTAAGWMKLWTTRALEGLRNRGGAEAQSDSSGVARTGFQNIGGIACGY